MLKKFTLPRPSFLRDTHGSVSVEAVLITPLLIWGMVSTYVFYDGFRHKTRVHVAANSVVDVLSRQTATITPQFVEDLNNVFDTLATMRGSTSMRITSVAQTAVDDAPIIAWSHGTRGIPAAQTLTDLTGAVPPILTGEAVVVLETFGTWQPPFPLLGMERMVGLNMQVTTRPRFVPWLHYEGSVPIFDDYDPEWLQNGPDSSNNPSVVSPPETPNLPDGAQTDSNWIMDNIVNPDGVNRPDGSVTNTGGNQTARPSRLVSMDFETGNTTGWSSSRIEYSAAHSYLLGRFGQNDTITYTRGLPSATSRADVTFDLYIIDSWDGAGPSIHTGPDGDRWQLLVNNELITTQHFTYTQAAGPVTRTATRSVNGVTYTVELSLVSAGTNTAFSVWSDQVWRVNMSVVNPPRNFSLSMRSDLSSRISDESWGIDNFTLAITQGGG